MERVMGKVVNGEWAWGVVEGSNGVCIDELGD